MALLTGSDLVADRFFASGDPVARGSSFDLTVGTILDHNGNKVDGPFVLKPGHMVQVVSAEVFKLPDAVTGHVTYKTALTRRGIWALTVGIVDPGWNGPVTTTLLNFSRIDYAVAPGDAFLRVSFFGHAPVPTECLPTCEAVETYLRGIQKVAMTQFPQTFLDKDEIAGKAGKDVLERIRKDALVWVGAIALLFGAIQFGLNFLAAPKATTGVELSSIQAQIGRLESRLREYEMRQALPPTTINAPPKPPARSTPPHQEAQ